ncbi:acyltransferase [Chitinivorax sp. PXF-14]|uniref:acyltransferase family protein n=1 Tax=Chitinivorax sp. PXF-14 TaxID=3230488 RepID=UPI0034652687
MQPSSPQQRIDYLDGWRGLAICTLLVGHFLPVPGINLGSVGVNLFFVLSGHLMARILFLQQMPLGLFYRRRIARIFPASYLFLAIVLALYLPHANPAHYWDIAAAFGFVYNYMPVHGYADSGLPIGHLWSLCVEEHSYILLSLVALAVRPRQTNPVRYLAGLLVLNVGFMVCYAKGLGWRDIEVYIRSECASFSILVSALFTLLAARGQLPRLPALAGPLAIGAGIVLHWWSVPALASHTVGIGLIALGFNLLPQAPAWVRTVLRLRGLRWMGLVSFSVYLWQQPFYHSHLPAWLGLPLAVLAGAASFYLFENPLRELLNRRWGKPAALVLLEGAAR